MGLKYGIRLQELMDFFCAWAHEGFTEQEVQAAEQQVGASLPPVYRSFLMTYGKDSVNTALHTINAPDEIWTTYQVIKEELEGDWAPEFEEAVQTGAQDEYTDNEYFSLWQLPVERWGEITANYVLIWCENQGVWNAGYLLQDLLDGKTDPPVYISTEDDFITFQKWEDNMEHFLVAILFEAAWEYGERYTKTPEIKSILASAGIDADQLKASGRIGTCIDDSNEMLYFYCEHKEYPELITVSREAVLERAAED